MFTVEKVHSRYYVVRDGSFDIIYVNIDTLGGITVNTEDQGVTMEQLQLAIAAFMNYHLTELGEAVVKEQQKKGQK